MGRAPVGIGQLEPGFREPCRHVVGIQRRILADPMHALATEQQRVGEGSQQNSGVARKTREPPDRFRQLLLREPTITPVLTADDRGWQVW